MQIRRAESLKPFNTLSLQASAAALVRVSNDQELAQAMDWSRSQGLPVLPLGEGSNVVLAGDLDALVVRQCNEDLKVVAEENDRVTLRISAGHDWHRLVMRTLEAGFYGLENLALIPGTVGAAPIQNIGAYGVEFERFVVAVQGLEMRTGEHLMLTAAECAFAYRDSVFKGELRDRVIITAVDIQLSRRPQSDLDYPALRDELARRRVANPQPEDVFAAVVDLRKRRLPDPDKEPNAGSFFKNPVISAERAQAMRTRWPGLPCFAQAGGRVKIPAAWLIEQAGWKGRRVGGVGVHPGHALVLVNHGSDSGKELLALAASIRESVSRQFEVTLEMEPRVYGLQA
ncbi:UDP-N-acetylmuramate dehydrogenase [Pseudohalioglobus lutimaris]|uniref:UDP-N-acetylmuramate dehydrogenase n=1 Tax=Pseudohalioglobus lutimaris TaxID=1737061 RepID=UPI001FAEA079|nr:UDP-N-acetylmuramate dehydrogenase [Pseudohalioglobus lutimaris]